jgi:hypothetical protein
MGMELIQTIEVTTNTSSITFASIPQGFTDLQILSSARTDRASTSDGIDLRLNGATANRSRRYLFGDGSTVFSGTGTDLRAGSAPSATATANTFGNAFCYIPNYSGSSAKSVSLDAVTENNATQSAQELNAGLWNDTSAISSIELRPSVGSNFVAGSNFYLYGII